MCGITGILDLNGHRVEQAHLWPMVDVIQHRGPDGKHVYVDKNLGLGHTRLAITDLSDRASQPMISADRRYSLIYNGEIYNHLELRCELEGFGYEFQSKSDTETLLYALVQWGNSVIPHLNGMFAFALWDTKRKELLLARDRYGIKPLYWSRKNNCFAFGSEIKSIIAHPKFSTELDKEGLLEYFTFQNFFSEHTLFKKINTFPAGFFMKLSSHRSEPVWTRYWDFKFNESKNVISPAEYEEELDRLFQNAVNRQMMGEVEIGAYLSGGIDSCAISSVVSKIKRNLKTFTCGFDLSSASGDELNYDERGKARELSGLMFSKNYQIELKSGDMEACLPSIIHYMDEPRVGQSYPNFYASKLASKHVKVVMSGTGGDELFAGYPWRYYHAAANHSFEDYIDKYYLSWQRLIPNKLIKKVFAPIWKDVNHVWTRDIFRDVFNEHSIELKRPEDYINHSLYFESKTFLHGLLIVEDKLSMATGLESRVPFLDNELVDFAMTVPLKMKLRKVGHDFKINENDPGNKVQKFYMKTRDGKLLLRKVMGRYLKNGNAHAVKQGFSGPDCSWFRGESAQFVKDLLNNPHALIYNYMDFDTIQKLVIEHLDGTFNRRLLIWSLILFELWCRKFIQ